MTGAVRRSGWLVGACVAGALLGGCGGGGDGDGDRDTEALITSFGEEAEAAYDAAGDSRSEDFSKGVSTDDCFILGADGADAVVEALGLAVDEPPEVGFTYLSGPPGQSESISCAIDVGGPDDATVTIDAGTMAADRDQVALALASSESEGAEEVDGEAPGLDPDDVVALVTNEGEVTLLGWVSDGFYVGLNVPTALAEPEAGLAALPVAVDAVTTALGGTPPER